MFSLKIGILLFVYLQIQYAHADTWFELKFESYTNPNSLEEDGDCCELLCQDPCDPKFAICFDSPEAGGCSLGRRHTGHYHANEIKFKSLFENKTPNPIRLKIPDAWPKTIFISITIDDDDRLNKDDRIGHKKKSFSNIPAINQSDAEWNHLVFRYPHDTSLTTVARVYCVDNYYGEDCNTFCVAVDNDFNGHYNCSIDGSKICHTNYYGPECKTYCVPNDDDTGHYYCGMNGEQLCNKGWVGDFCTKDINECLDSTNNPCTPNGNCTNTNGSYSCMCTESFTGEHCDIVKLFCDDDPCSNTSQCNNTLGGFVCHCDDEWTGRLCDVPVTPCTSSPCINEGTCSYVGDVYECKCVGKWIGVNCELENNVFLNDTKLIYLDGNLTEDKVDDFNNGLRNLLSLIGIEEVAIDTSFKFYPSINQTKVETFIESRDRRVAGAIARMLQHPPEVLQSNLVLPLSKSQDLIKEPLSGKPTPWVKKHWYAVLVIVLAIICVIAIVTLSFFLYRQRNARKSKMAEEAGKTPANHSNSDQPPPMAIGFDNSVYYEINQPDKLKGMSH